jgi:hypothetical protein
MYQKKESVYNKSVVNGDGTTNDNYSKIILFSRHVNFTICTKMQQEAENVVLTMM